MFHGPILKDIVEQVRGRDPITGCRIRYVPLVWKRYYAELFIEPTLDETRDGGYRLLCEEIFGPVVTAYPYQDSAWRETLETIDRTSPYALTGSVFSTDRGAILEATDVLRNAAGNFYINDKPTGAVVGQQPFGGARASGTNDKAGSKLNLLRWVSARTIKETFSPPRDHRYAYMSEE